MGARKNAAHSPDPSADPADLLGAYRNSAMGAVSGAFGRLIARTCRRLEPPDMRPKRGRRSRLERPIWPEKTNIVHSAAFRPNHVRFQKADFEIRDDFCWSRRQTGFCSSDHGQFTDRHSSGSNFSRNRAPTWYCVTENLERLAGSDVGRANTHRFPFARET